MFTGLVEEIGEIIKIDILPDSRRIRIKSDILRNELKIKDSISINGCCQTIVELGENCFDVVSINETLSKTTFGSLEVGHFVNLELAIQANSRLGGHFVQGHIDSVGFVSQINKLENSWEFWVEFNNQFTNLVIPVGSITINGVSLTTARIENNKLMVAIIPYTFEKTNFQFLKLNDKVNLEFDMIGKYIVKYLDNMRLIEK